MKLLSEGCKASKENLDREEKEGLKSLQQRVKAAKLIIAQTDKSGKFAILTKDQYLEAAAVHSTDDKEIGLDE